jgi:hypothetical protein
LIAAHFLKGKQHGKFEPHPSNSPMGVFKNYSFCYINGNNYQPLAILCHVVYATKGFFVRPLYPLPISDKNNLYGDAPVAAGISYNVSGCASGNVSFVVDSVGRVCGIASTAYRGDDNISAAAHDNGKVRNHGDVPVRQTKTQKTTHTNDRLHGYNARPQKFGTALHKGLALLSTL